MMSAKCRRVKTVLQNAEAHLARAQVEEPKTEAEMLLAWVLRCTRTELSLYGQKEIPGVQEKRFWELLSVRGKERLPLAYVLGTVQFMDVELKVTPDVLIPRPETEILVEKIVHSLDKEKPYEIMDVGTGSGAIAIALAYYLPKASLRAIDISPEALAVAKENVLRHNLEGRVALEEGDLLELWEHAHKGPADVIAANLPYVSTEEMRGLSQEMHHEPVLALEAGPTGLELIQRLLPQAFHNLKSRGQLFVEIGYNQGDRVQRLFQANGFEQVMFHQDDAGEDRIVSGIKIP